MRHRVAHKDSHARITQPARAVPSVEVRLDPLGIQFLQARQFLPGQLASRGKGSRRDLVAFGLESLQDGSWKGIGEA